MSPIASLAMSQAAKQGAKANGGAPHDARSELSTPAQPSPSPAVTEPKQSLPSAQEVGPIEMDHDKMKALVRETWEQVNDDLEDFGMKIFMRLFKTAPKVLRLFSFRDEEALTRIVKLKKHAVITMNAIGKVIDNLDDVSEMVSFLKQLGRSHAPLKVESEHFDAFGVALLLTLQHELGSEWTSDVSDAWQMAYDDVKQVLVEAMEEEATRLRA